METFLNTLTAPETIVTREIFLSESFLDFAGKLAEEPGTVLLASGGQQECARYHLLAVRPWLILRTKGNHVTLRTQTNTASFTINPLTALRCILERFHFCDSAAIAPAATELPVVSGLFGYFAYDLKDSLEALPRTCLDDLNLPDIYLTAPRLLFLHDRRQKHTTVCLPLFPGESQADRQKELTRILRLSAPADRTEGKTGNFRSNFQQNEYQQAVRTIIDYIAAGDVYQVNLSQRFETGFTGHPYCLFRKLFKKNPAAFFSYIHAGNHHILSTSPERFLKQRGSVLETRPIKGTRPRGKTATEDERNRSELLASTKDDAELSMIVDLLRNDLGKVCRPGSVRVCEHKKLEAYENVFHLVSIIQGLLEEGRNAADIMAATFPGGSITGCPKIRAMEIIDELEPVCRHIYTGSIGYISFHDTLDLSIAIRTATICNQTLFYAAGGGIVYDSQPEEEFAETLAKAQTLLTGGNDHEHRKRSRYIWLNGKLQPAETASVPVGTAAFQYGAGLFETIRAERGHPLLLPAHLHRLRTSWRTLFSVPVPDLTWEDILYQVLDANDLLGLTAAAKILAAPGDSDLPPFRPILAVLARPYTHRLQMLNKKSLDLAVYPHPRQILTASHKTLNYFFYKLAGDWAQENSADEALIRNPDQTVSETNTANLLLISGHTVTVPASPNVLNGVMQQAALQWLEKNGFQKKESPVTLADCLAAENMILTNSLMGAVPVGSLDGHPLVPAIDLCARITATVFGRPSA